MLFVWLQPLPNLFDIVCFLCFSCSYILLLYWQFTANCNQASPLKKDLNTSNDGVLSPFLYPSYSHSLSHSLTPEMAEISVYSKVFSITAERTTSFAWLSYVEHNIRLPILRTCTKLTDKASPEKAKLRLRKYIHSSQKK